MNVRTRDVGAEERLVRPSTTCRVRSRAEQALTESPGPTTTDGVVVLRNGNDFQGLEGLLEVVEI